VFWVISVYFNIRNTLLKFGTFLLGHPVYRTLHVSDSFSVHHQESSTVHTAIGICHIGFADCLLASSARLLMMDRRNCLKHVELYSTNKFEKVVHLVGFIIRIYHGSKTREVMSGLNI
jgi:hypothetical protein